MKGLGIIAKQEIKMTMQEQEAIAKKMVKQLDGILNCNGKKFGEKNLKFISSFSSEEFKNAHDFFKTCSNWGSGDCDVYYVLLAFLCGINSKKGKVHIKAVLLDTDGNPVSKKAGKLIELLNLKNAI